MESKQEIFNEVWKRIVAQGGPSYSNGNTCKYRNKDGRGCAIGCLIDDETASKWDELAVSDIYTVQYKLTETVPEWIKIYTGFLRKLQRIHDCLNGYGLNDEEWILKWKEKMKEFAIKENLKTPEEG